jgi:POT family proton-dependent oligopeptide transporter
MAIQQLSTFYLGLLLIVLGTGLLKPNISTMVGALYRPDDHRRDGGFSIFYMGINIGAFAAPLVCGYLGENINWHYGFAAAGVGMTLGVVQYALGGRYLGNAGLTSSGSARDRFIFRKVLLAAVVLAAIGVALTMTGALSLSAEAISTIFGVVLLSVVVALFGYLFTWGDYTPVERRRFGAILVLFLAAALFWSAFEQAGSTLNLFAERNTNLHRWDAPVWGLFRASYFQALNSVFIIALAPVWASRY